MDGYTTDKTRRGVPILGVDVWEHACECVCVWSLCVSQE